ncbi:MAG: tetratricopeptide repeat protein [Spirochaetia bacterium]|nr:tetratricopeptide repeat protein [Spirochaetia bacterium]
MKLDRRQKNIPGIIKVFPILFLFYFPGLRVWPKNIESVDYKVELKLSQYSNQKKYEAVIFLGNAFFQKSRDPNKQIEEYLLNGYERQIEALIYARQAAVLYKNNQILPAQKTIDAASEKSPFSDIILQLKDKIDSAAEKINQTINLSVSQKAELEKLLTEGRNSLNREKNREALDIFNKALNISPSSPEAIEGYNLALSRTKSAADKIVELLARTDKFVLEKKYPEALSVLEEIFTYDSANATAINRKKEINNLIKQMAQISQKQELAKEYLQSGNNLADQNEYAQAIEKYNLGYGILPDYTNWKKLIQDTEKKQKENEERAFSKSLEDIAKSYQKGMYYIASEEFSKAITEFEIVINISKKYGQEQTIKQAEEFLQKARDNFKRKEEEIVGETNPYYKMINNTKILGINAFRANNFTVAKEYFGSILELFPKNRFAMIYYLKCDMELNPGSASKIINQFMQDIKSDMEKEPSEAKRLLGIAMDLDPKNPELILLSRKITRTSQSIIKKSDLPPATLEQWYSQAFNAFTQENDAQKANDLLTKIINEDPTFVKAVTLKARIEGRTRIVKTRTIAPEAQKFYSEGLWHYGQGRIQEAKNSFDQAIKIDPDYQNAVNAREKCIKYLQQAKGS